MEIEGVESSRLVALLAWCELNLRQNETDSFEQTPLEYLAAGGVVGDLAHSALGVDHPTNYEIPFETWVGN